MENLMKKLKQNKGFSLAELLVATLILLLTSGMLVVCIQLGIKQLYKNTQDSEAQMLCTTLSTAIQDELTYASDIRVSNTTAGNTITFAKEGMSDSVGFYIASESEDSDAADPSTFEFTAVTDDSAFSAINLGKIYLASTDGSNNITNTYGLVSTGAYNIENSSYGSLRAGMQLSETSEGYQIKVNVYNGSDDTTPLATKEFYVGKVTADRTDEVDVDTSADTMTRTLTFDPNGGKFADNTTGVKTYKGLTVGTAFSAPSVSRLPGYEFKGWLDTNGVLNTSGSVTVAEDMTYTAQWNVKSYTAYFYMDSSAMASGTSLTTISGEYGSVINLPNTGNLSTLQKDGYEFAGWEDQSGTVYPVDGASWTVNGDQKFVATWTPKKYTVTFYKNYDNSGNPTDLIETKEVYYMDTFEFPAEPTIEHYDFKGWEYERALNDKVTTNVGSMVYSFTKNMVFVAKWEEHEYTATFFYELNGQRVTIDESLLAYGERLYFPSPLPVVNGYQIVGWKYSYGGSETNLSATTASIIFNFNQNMEFEAVLEPYYVASFYLDQDADASLEKTNIYKENGTYSIALPTQNGVTGMTKEGYVFRRWTYSLDSGENWLTGEPGDVVTITGNTDFYGVWEEADYYTVTFDPGTNGSVTPTSYRADINETITLPTPTWTGGNNNRQNFIGWRIDGTGRYYQGNYTVTSSVNFVAAWAPNNNIYTVTYRLPDDTTIGGTSGNIARYVARNSVIYLESPDGYDPNKTIDENGGLFRWGTRDVGSSYTVNGNVTFNGSWSNTWNVNVVFNPNGGQWSGGCSGNGNKDQDFTSYMTFATVESWLASQNANISRNGYTFKGWSIDRVNVVDPDDIVGYNKSTGSRRTSVTLYAIWE